MIGTPFQQDVLRRLSTLGPVYIVGGAVRDVQLGIPLKDVDAVTAIPFHQIEKNLSDWGYTPHVIGDHQPTISLFRDKARIDISLLAGNVEADALRRDFTINAIYQDVRTGEIKDPLEGLQALSQRMLRACGRAEERFQEDPLRILRLIRLAIRYDFLIEQDTWRAANENLTLLKSVALERVSEELGRILVLDQVDRALGLLDDLHYIEEYIPELYRLKGLEQNKFHTKDAWDHTRHVVKNAPPQVLLRLAALFHDLGKWETASRECHAWGTVTRTDEGYYLDKFQLFGKDIERWTNKEVEIHGGRLDNRQDTIVIKRIKPLKSRPEVPFQWVVNGKRHFLQHEKDSARLVKELLSRFRWSVVLPGGKKGEQELLYLVGHHMLGTLTFINEMRGERDNPKINGKARRFAWQVGWDGQYYKTQKVENLLDLWKADFLGGKQDAEKNLYRLDWIQREIRRESADLEERGRLLDWGFFERFACSKGLAGQHYGQFKEHVRKHVMLNTKNTLTDLRFLEQEYKFFSKLPLKNSLDPKARAASSTGVNPWHREAAKPTSQCGKA
ncbi:tRNA nucleotidyltransferase/poly(A) polymerase [Desulfosporosinus orientis DSM 765]|uniref:tRNA nucleotidyltransferase/poly(A) polymerase n=1 Tax=Desulfosporosinus orientis (strain ATCC 19365 / DSM 765 / NCIMB 8382 / VKM B-1628 / Singapore I) TaxID=768706 RepID=G7WIP3_DESOD|nr:CCA tRNA nucleotidyltransferase [Desulfosporosinus orientis]AET69117.1 tRNA nucleotidyltransferase/poly(A) polymerase [Desulfosporosinus orientis DSM 765]